MLYAMTHLPKSSSELKTLMFSLNARYMVELVKGVLTVDIANERY